MSDNAAEDPEMMNLPMAMAEIRDLRTQLAATLKERDEALARFDFYQREFQLTWNELSRLLAALDLTDELRDALIAAGLGSLSLADVRAILAIIKAQTGLPAKEPG